MAGGKRITDKFIPLINKGINDGAIKKKQDSLEKTVERPSKEERCLDNSFTLYCLVKKCSILAPSLSLVRAAPVLRKQHVF